MFTLATSAAVVASQATISRYILGNQVAPAPDVFRESKGGAYLGGEVSRTDLYSDLDDSVYRCNGRFQESEPNWKCLW